MVNSVVAAEKALCCSLMKLAGLKAITVEIQPGTKIRLWAPSKPPKHQKKPVVVLLHGFAANANLTWMFQVGGLTKNYSVYVPDLLFFGGSFTDRSDRSPIFQADCLVECLGQLGIENTIVVGFSYGGMVAFKMAEKYPEFVQALVISGSTVNLSDWVNDSNLSRLGFSSLQDMLLPTSVQGLKTLFSLAMYNFSWLLRDRLYRDYLEVMFTYRKEKSELLDALAISKSERTIPDSIQIHLIWGQEDQIFKTELAENMKQKLGPRTSMVNIKKGGHLVHIECPWAYNRQLKIFLASLEAAK
ncbi:hypothetical protein ACHQM5_016430 [Ranunculus cassubicifolius]